MSEISSNLINQQQPKLEKNIETAGTIAQNKPPVLFNTTAETAGTIASSSTSPNNGSSFCANA